MFPSLGKTPIPGMDSLLEISPLDKGSEATRGTQIANLPVPLGLVSGRYAQCGLRGCVACPRVSKKQPSHMASETLPRYTRRSATQRKASETPPCEEGVRKFSSPWQSARVPSSSHAPSLEPKALLHGLSELRPGERRREA